MHTALVILMPEGARCRQRSPGRESPSVPLERCGLASSRHEPRALVCEGLRHQTLERMPGLMEINNQNNEVTLGEEGLALLHKTYRTESKFPPDDHEKILHIPVFKCPLRNAKLTELVE